MEKFKKIRKITTIVYVVSVLVCLFLFLISRNKIVFADRSLLVDVATGQEERIEDSIKLLPGIYEADFEYSQNTDSLYGGFVYVFDDDISENGLRCSGSPVYDGLCSNRFEFYLLEPSDSLYFKLVSFDTDITVTDFVIKNTGKQWLVILTYISFIYCVSLLLIAYFRKDFEGKISRENKTAVVCLLLIGLISAVPALCNKTLSTADNGYHMQRIEGVASALLSGQIPVRIEPHWVQGHGYADAIFYCDLFLVFPAFLRIIGFSVTTAYNAYVLLVNFVTVIISYRVFKEIFRKQPIALTGVLLYTFSSMHFFKLIQTGAIGEGTAMCFLPLVLLGLYRIFYTDTKSDEYKKAYLPMAVGFTGIISCHVLSSEITALFVLFMCILNIPRFRSLKVWREMIKAALSAFLMCAWFIVPFLDYYLTQDIHVKHVFARTIQEFGYAFPEMYLFIADGRKYIMGIGPVLFVGLLIFMIIFVVTLFSSKRKEEYASMRFALHFWLMTAVMMLFSLEFFPWDRIQSYGGFLGSIISSIQFPNRFLGWGVLSAVTVFCYTNVYLEKKSFKKDYHLLLALALFLTVFSFVYLNDGYLKEVQQYYIANSEGMGNGYISGGEYILQGTDEADLHYKEAVAGPGVHYDSYEKDNLKISLNVNNENDSESYVDLPLIAFKGYRAKGENGRKLPVTIGRNNTLRVILDAGYKGTVKVGYVSPIYWRAAELISILCFGVILYFEYFKKKKQSGIVTEKESLYVRVPLYEGNRKALIISRIIVFVIEAFLIFVTPFLAGDYMKEDSKILILCLTVLAFSGIINILLKKNDKEKLLIPAGLAGILILSCIPVFGAFDQGVGLIGYWNEKVSSVIGKTPGVTIWILCLLTAQILTLLSVYFMSSIFFDKEEDCKRKALIATLLIMSAPSGFYMSYVKYDASEIILRILMPLFIGLLIKGIKDRSVLFICTSFLTAILCIPVFAFKYVYTSQFFSDNAYAFGQLFSTFSFKELKPGTGVPIILALGCEAACLAVGYDRKDSKKTVLFIAAAVFSAMALVCFPWDVICRISGLVRKVILHFGSPEFFIGPATLLLGLLGARGLGLLKKSRNEFVSGWLGNLICAFAAAVWVFLSNETIYGLIK